MAIKATIFKVNRHTSDMDRRYYQPHDLTIARHPLEIDVRMMLRIVFFVLNAGEQSIFIKGLSLDDVPDLREVALTGGIKSLGQANHS